MPGTRVTVRVLRVFLFFSAVLPACCDHFRGGTISWRSTGTPNQVEFNFKMGWTYGRGPGCTQNKIGQLLSMSGSWMCTAGCGGPVAVGDVSYYCTAANPGENWEQGQNSFTYTFPGQGPFTVGFAGSAWMALDGGKGSSSWNLETVIDLRQRSDTSQPNASPVTLSKPIYYSQFDCDHSIRIPVLDPDGDQIRCRMATGNECQSVCDALPGVTLDQDTCTLTFRPDAASTYNPGGWYAVAMTVEDTPRSPITVGGKLYNPGDVLTSVPVQFLIQTPTSIQPCDWRPVFVNDTPAEGAQIVVKAGYSLELKACATNSKNTAATISSILVLGPQGMAQGAVTPDSQGRSNVVCKHLTWTPTPADEGQHIVCAIADDSTRRSSEPRCFSIKAWDIDPCDSTPCQHSGTCARKGVNGYTCTCAPGYTDHTCSTDVDECASSPCEHGGWCVDEVNAFRCVCPVTYTDPVCGTDVDDCVSGPCQNGGVCTDLVGSYNCTCAPGYNGTICQIGVDHCASGPCLSGGVCVNDFHGYTCLCRGSWTGINCAVLIQTGPFNASANSVSQWPGLGQSLSGQRACPRLAYSACHCVIARNLHVAGEDGEDARRAARDALAMVVGMPIGVAVGVATYLLLERLCCGSTGASCCAPRAGSRRAPFSRPNVSCWRQGAAPAPSRSGGPGKGAWGLPPVVESSKAGVAGGGGGGRGGRGTGPTLITNVYRATFGDSNVHATAVKKRPDTYTSGSPDWAA